MGEKDLDRSAARAWDAFRARLADRVAAMEDDDVLVVEAETGIDPADGASPYVQFCAWGEDRVRCEVSGNAYLAEVYRLDEDCAHALLDYGWEQPEVEEAGLPTERGTANFHLDLRCNQADRLALLAVQALRDVFGVVHPVFLNADGLEPSGAEAVASEPQPEEEPEAVAPADPEHLRSLVDRALAPVVGGVPQHDEDDDIPVIMGDELIFVRVADDSPVVRLFSAVVIDVEDQDRAIFEIGVLNRDERFLKFVLNGDTVMVYLDLPAAPFAPQHLRGAMVLMAETLTSVGADLAARVDGRRIGQAAEEDEAADDVADDSADDFLLTPDEAPDEAPDERREDEEPEETPDQPGRRPSGSALQTLLELDAEAPGSVDPALAASICGMDRGLVLRLIRENSEQEIAWRQARDRAVEAGDPDDEAEVCDHEMRHAERTVSLLRQALRVVVEREAARGRYPVEAPPRTLPPKPRRRRSDAALPGLDDSDDGLWD